MIYVVSVLDGSFVKLGYSSQELSSRISELQTGCPFEIKKLFTIPGTLMQEKSLHASLNSAFARIRVPIPPNEWYPARNPFLKEFLENLRNGFDFGLSFSEQYNQSVKQGSTRRDTNLVPNFKWPHCINRRTEIVA